MQRRGFISALAGLAACPLCPRIAAAAGAEWSYDGPTGPAHWSELRPGYAVCGTGAQQSPIDITNPVPSGVGGFPFSWPNRAGSIDNNGHTIQVNVAASPEKNTVTVAEFGRTPATVYDMLQYHFHTPSEHALSGQRQEMEVHFVHFNTSIGAYAVVGALLAGGPADQNNALAQIVEKAPRIPGAPPVPINNVALESLIPPRASGAADRNYFRYAGSLTIPPCEETITWLLYASVVTVPQDAIDGFKRLYKMNARPIQPRYRRFILGL